MSKTTTYQKLIYAIGLVLSVLFIYTATSKLVQLDTFQSQLERMPYLSPYAIWLTWTVPFTELVIAGLLLIEKHRTLAIYASLCLLGFFTIYITAVVQFSDSIPCSCGGVLSMLGWQDHILFNLTFMALAFCAILLNKKQNKQKLLDQDTT